MKKEIIIRTRKGLNVELNNLIQPGGYKEIWIFEMLIDGDVVEQDEMCDLHQTLLETVESSANKALNYIETGEYK